MNHTYTTCGSSGFGVIGRVTPRYGQAANTASPAGNAGEGKSSSRLLSALGTLLPWRSATNSLSLE